MNRSSFLAGTLCLVLLAGCKQKEVAIDPPSRFRAAEYGVTFEMPTGWKMDRIPGLTAPIAHGESRNEFAVNINVVSEPFAGSNDDYADANTKTLEKMGYKISGRSVTTTAAGGSAIRMIGESEQGSRKLRQVFYLFDGRKGSKIVMTCTALAEDEATHDAEFDAAFKTVRVEK